ncbi:MAG: DNA-processing protein DprA [Muribaculaceae bacterium]|nr:DNA-processing protein DprA [Muribaculaceae bacterium]
MTFDKDTEIKVALSMCKGVTSALVKHLEDCDVDLATLFDGRVSRCLENLGLRPNLLQDLDLGEALFKARKEIEVMKRHSIEPIFILDDSYPVRLYDIPDAPIMLYKLGNANLNNHKLISIVGTRDATPRGMAMTKQFVEEFSKAYPGVTIVSGLAYGIDSAAHISALDHGLPTIAVLAHGLQMIYPAANRDLARQILSRGGAILSEYSFGTQPYRGHFLERNRIVAGISDVTIVMESDVKGGAMSTARCADEYNRCVLAVPGRPSDRESSGCNQLIRRHRAEIITAPSELSDAIGWIAETPTPAQERSLFPELDGDNKAVYEYLYSCDRPCHFDEIHNATNIPVAHLMALLSELEFDGIVVRHPGNRYSVLR